MIKIDESAPHYAMAMYKGQTNKEKNQAECDTASYRSTCMKVASLNSTASGASAALPEESPPHTSTVPAFSARTQLRYSPDHRTHLSKRF